MSHIPRLVRIGAHDDLLSSEVISRGREGFVVARHTDEDVTESGSLDQHAFSL